MPFLLSDQLKTTAASLQLSLLLLQPHRVDVIEPTSHSDVISRLAGSGLGTCLASKFSRVEELWSVHRNKEAILEEHRQEVLQAANVAKDWDIQVHLRALDAEVARTVSIRS